MSVAQAKHVPNHRHDSQRACVGHTTGQPRRGFGPGSKEPVDKHSRSESTLISVILSEHNHDGHWQDLIFESLDLSARPNVSSVLQYLVHLGRLHSALPWIFLTCSHKS